MGAMTDTGELRFTKGHGTENDFVLVADLDGSHYLTAGQVRLLTDRRAGIGGDGLIRVVPTQAAAEQHVRDQGAQARWFMDYRNADGGSAEMCGNGARVFAAYLRREGLETADEFAIATRGGRGRCSPPTSCWPGSSASSSSSCAATRSSGSGSRSRSCCRWR